MNLIYSRIRNIIIFTGLVGGLWQISYGNLVQAKSTIERPVYILRIQKSTVAQYPTSKNQALSGVWIGKFTQNREPTTWNMKMTLSQKGELIDGISVHEPIVDGVIAASVTYNLRGTLSDNTFEFMEGKMLERNAPSSWYFCNISGKLNLANSGKYKVLRGYWECTYQGERFFGKVILRKQ
jgi:hypothetical protein